MRQISSINLNIHSPVEVSAGTVVSAHDFSGVPLYVRTAEGAEVTLHFYFREGDKHRQHANALREAINALGIGAPDPEPSQTATYDCDPIAEQRMDAADVEEVVF